MSRGDARVSVVICAYTLDRWELLSRAIASVQAQELAPEQLIVVADHADELLHRARSAFPGCDVVANSGPRGLSGARNTGVAAARSAIVAFIDDDAEADPAWLATLVPAFDDSAVVGVGGRVRPRWLQGRPDWFPAAFDWVIGCTYRGHPMHVAEVRNVLGCNMAFRRSALLSVDGFRSELGRVGKLPVGAEETDLCIRLTLLDPAARIKYLPGAAVDHVVPPERATWSYFARRCFGEGLSKAVLAHSLGSRRALSTERSYVRAVLPRAAAGAVAEAARRRRPAILGQTVAIAAGLALTVAGFGWGSVRRRQTVVPATFREAR